MSATIVLPYNGEYEFLRSLLTAWTKYSVTLADVDLLVISEPTSEAYQNLVMGTLYHHTKMFRTHTLMVNQQPLRLFGSWNKGMEHATTEDVVLWKPDLMPCPEWDKSLLGAIRDDVILTARVVESGQLLIDDRTIWRNFGYTASTFKWSQWEAWCKIRKNVVVTPYDLPRYYLPVCMTKATWAKTGPFEEEDGPSHTLRSYRSVYSWMLRAQRNGLALQEDQRCFAYHFQFSPYKKWYHAFERFINIVYHDGVLLRDLHTSLTGFRPLYESLREPDTMGTL